MTDSGLVERFGFACTGELAVNIPELPRPTLAELHRSSKLIMGIESDLSPYGAVQCRIARALREDETRLAGPDYELRISEGRAEEKLLGFQQAFWLMGNQGTNPAVQRLLGRVSIDFPGIVVRFKDHSLRIPCFTQDGGWWNVLWHPVDREVLHFRRIAFNDLAA